MHEKCALQRQGLETLLLTHCLSSSGGRLRFYSGKMDATKMSFLKSFYGNAIVKGAENRRA